FSDGEHPRLPTGPVELGEIISHIEAVAAPQERKVRLVKLLETGKRTAFLNILNQLGAEPFEEFLRAQFPYSSGWNSFLYRTELEAFCLDFGITIPPKG